MIVERVSAMSPCASEEKFGELVFREILWVMTEFALHLLSRISVIQVFFSLISYLKAFSPLKALIVRFA